MVALGASAADALTFNPAFQIPDWLHPIITFPGIAGAYCVPFASGALGLGHGGISASWEFALSLPFNFALYWLLFRVSAFVIMFLFPASRGRQGTTSIEPTTNDEFNRQV